MLEVHIALPTIEECMRIPSPEDCTITVPSTQDCIVIFSSEDVGNADPRAITVALNAMQAVEMIGMP